MTFRWTWRQGLVLWILLGLSSLATPSWARTPWDAGKKYALVVGIDDYLNDSVTDLKFATADATLFKETLVKEGQFPEENIFLLTSQARGESARPSLTNIVFRLEWLREVVGPGDTLVFYFAGHGVSMDSETFLLTEEADQRSKNTLMVSSLPGKVLNALLKDAGALNTLVLLDACRNDPTAGRGDVNNLLSESMARGLVFQPLPSAAAGLERNTATVFSCSEGERSWEWGDKGQGFFTFYLAEALRTGAYDSQGQATLQGLVSYLRERVHTATLRETNQTQTPMLKYEGPGADRWVLASSASKVQPSADDQRLAFEKAELVARVEASEMEKKRLADENASLKAKNELIAAENRALSLAQTARSGDPKAQRDLAVAQAELELAKADVEVTNERLAFSSSAFSQAAIKMETIGVAKSMAFGGQASGSAELKAKLEELESRLEALETEKRAAVERALMAERRLRIIQNNPVLDGRPNRSTRRYDLWRWEEADDPEAPDDSTFPQN